jgi:phage N-6-adenine-methyltransferase
MRRKCQTCRKALTASKTGRPRRFCSDRCRVAAWRKRRAKSRGYMPASLSDDWATPQDVFDRLDARYGPLTLDVAATAENAKCERYFTRSADGLAQEWTGRVWMNPPYGHALNAWMRKAWEASQTTADLVVCLVPVRSDTRWWHEYAQRGEVELLRGRLHRGGAPRAAPFASAVVVFRNAASVTELVQRPPTH